VSALITQLKTVMLRVGIGTETESGHTSTRRGSTRAMPARVSLIPSKDLCSDGTVAVRVLTTVAATVFFSNSSGWQAGRPYSRGGGWATHGPSSGSGNQGK